MCHSVIPYTIPQTQETKKWKQPNTSQGPVGRTYLEHYSYCVDRLHGI